MANGGASRCFVPSLTRRARTNCGTSSSTPTRNTKPNWRRPLSQPATCNLHGSRCWLSVEGCRLRKRPLGSEAFLDFLPEEGRLHAAVDDLPRKKVVAAAIAV